MTIPALLPLYLDLLALHVFSVIVWVTGMVVLPVVYLHHRALSTTSEAARAFIALERQIFKRIVKPSIFATWTFGLLLILTPGAISWRAPWWLIKFVAILVLSGHHGVLSVW
jgi:protoporphyrinogen IX oxidase